MTKPLRPPENPRAEVRAAVGGAGAATAKASNKHILDSASAPGLNADALALIENASDIVFTHDLTGRVTYLNATASRITGYSKEEGLTMNIIDIVAPDHKMHATETMHRKLAGEPIFGVYEVDILTRYGERIPMEVNNQVVYDNGRPVGMHGIARDLRERRREHQALQESESRFRALAGDGAIFHLHLQGRPFRLCQPGDGTDLRVRPKGIARAKSLGTGASRPSRVRARAQQRAAERRQSSTAL